MMRKSIMTTIVAAIAIASIAMVLGLPQTQSSSAALPQGNNVYVFAEGVNPRVTFTFSDGVEISDFQVFTQTAGTSGTNGRGTQPEFTLVKVPGNTPYLYKAADELLEKGSVSGGSWVFNNFNARVDLMQAGEPVRSVIYSGCEVNSYKIYTDYDKEEAYVTGGKTGFVLQDEFKLLCKGQKMLNPTLDQMQKDQVNQLKSNGYKTKP